MEFSEKPGITPAKISQMEAARNIEGLLDLLDQTVAVLYRRTAAKALAAIAPASAVPALAARLASEPDRAVRQTLVKALGRLGDDQGLDVLIAALKDRDMMVCHEAALALARFNSPAAFEALLETLQQKDSRESWQSRRFAALALGKLGDRRALPALIAILYDESDLVPPAAAEALGELGDRQAISALKTARHTTPHRKGAECATCQAIDAALKRLDAIK
jgi:HEAT repeat protein